MIIIIYISWVWWSMFVIPATQEAEAGGGLFEGQNGQLKHIFSQSIQNETKHTECIAYIVRYFFDSIFITENIKGFLCTTLPSVWRNIDRWFQVDKKIFVIASTEEMLRYLDVQKMLVTLTKITVLTWAKTTNWTVMSEVCFW